MTAHVATVPAIRTDHTLRSLLLVLSAVAATFVLVLAALIGSAYLNPPTAYTEAGVASELLATAATIDAHGIAMMDHGARLATAARLSNDPIREHWIADGDHMIVDGQSIRAIADQLRSAARLLGDHPMDRSQVDMATLDGEATALIAEGNGAMDHGVAMVQHATQMLLLARQPGSAITESDAALMSADAPNIISAGERVTEVGQTLRAFARQMRQSLGR